MGMKTSGALEAVLMGKKASGELTSFASTSARQKRMRRFCAGGAGPMFRHVAMMRMVSKRSRPLAVRRRWPLYGSRAVFRAAFFTCGLTPLITSSAMLFMSMSMELPLAGLGAVATGALFFTSGFMPLITSSAMLFMSMSMEEDGPVASARCVGTRAGDDDGTRVRVPSSETLHTPTSERCGNGGGPY